MYYFWSSSTCPICLWSKFQFNHFFKILLTADSFSWTKYSQRARAGSGFNELNQEVQHHQGGWGHSPDHPPCSDKSWKSGFLRKSIIWFWGAPSKFFDPPNPFLALETPLLGGHTSKTFWSELWFWSYRFWNSHFFGKISTGYLQNNGPDQKVWEVWPPKSGVSKAKYGFLGP